MNSFLRKVIQSPTLYAGLIVFTMFFGAGNLIFPLALGRDSGDQALVAFSGLFVTAVAGPIVGLIGIVLYEGDYRAYFDRLGVIPGFLGTLTAVSIMGPPAVVPRCVVLAHVATSEFLPTDSLFIFTLVAGALIFLVCYDKSKFTDLLGRYMSPILVCLLVLIIFRAVYIDHEVEVSTMTARHALMTGLVIGYDTMDLLSSLSFGSALFLGLKLKFRDHPEDWSLKMISLLCVRAGLLGGTLIGLIYLGLCLGSSFAAPALTGVPPEKLLMTLAGSTVGPILTLMAGLTVALACFTTAVTLVMVFSDFLRKQVFMQRLSYVSCLGISVVITVLCSNLGFQRIMDIIHPVIAIMYPATIVLTICNIGHKLWGWTVVKAPFFGTLVATAIWQLCL